MTIGALFCFVLAAALMIISLASGRRHGALDLQKAPIELASAAWRN